MRSVEANTRADGRELLATAARIGLRVTTRPYAFDRAAPQAQHVSRQRCPDGTTRTGCSANSRTWRVCAPT